MSEDEIRALIARVLAENADEQPEEQTGRAVRAVREALDQPDKPCPAHYAVSLVKRLRPR